MAACAAPADRPAAFLDRDGVINIDRGYTFRREDFAFVPGALEAAAQLAALGYALVVVTNQSGIGRGLYTEADFLALTGWMQRQFAEAGAPLAGVYFCPHHPQAALPAYRRDCDCRKPAPGLLRRAIAELRLAPARSVLFGDKASDLQAAQAAGVPLRVLLGLNGESAPAADADGAALATARHASLHAAVQALAPRLAAHAAQGPAAGADGLGVAHGPSPHGRPAA